MKPTSGISHVLTVALLVSCAIAITLVILHLLATGASLVNTHANVVLVYGEVFASSSTSFKVAFELVNGGSLRVVQFDLVLIDVVRKKPIVKVLNVRLKRPLPPGSSLSCSVGVNVTTLTVTLTCSLPVYSSYDAYVYDNVVSGQIYRLIIRTVAENGETIVSAINLIAHA